MKNFYIFILITFCLAQTSVAQNSMGVGTTTPNPNAVLDLVSPTGDQGLLVPRLSTSERTAMSLSTEENGLMVFDSDEGKFYFWMNTEWLEVSNGSAATPSPWVAQDSSISYQGKVGVNTDTVLADFQVGDLAMFHFENSGFELDAEIIADNLHADGEDLYTINDGPSSFIFFDSGTIEFLHGQSAPAGTSLLGLPEAISSSLTLHHTRDAEFYGSVKIGSVRDSSVVDEGALSYDGDLYLYTYGEWKRLGGLEFPFSANINDGGYSPFFIENNGFGGVASFQVMNSGAFGPALNLYSNSLETSANVLDITHDGNGQALNIHANGASSTSDAVFVNNVGLGNTGYFRTDNGSSTAPNMLLETVNGNGTVLDVYTSGGGRGARIQIDNVSNTASALDVRSTGTGTVAMFSKFNSNAASAVEINNTSGTGAGLTIQNLGGTTRFGDESFIAGNLGIGTISPSPTAMLDVQGKAEINGDVEITGSMNSSGSFSTGVQTITGDYVIQDTDHIIELNATGGTAEYFVTLPNSALNPGREIIFLLRGTGTVRYNIQLQGANQFVYKGVTDATDRVMSQYAFGEWTMLTLKAVGNFWHIVHYIVNDAA